MNKEKVKEFWDDIIRNPDGSINEEQLYKELSDFSTVMDEVPEVYTHITGNKLSKITYPARTVIQEMETLWIEKDIAMSDILDIVRDCEGNEVIEEIKKYFS